MSPQFKVLLIAVICLFGSLLFLGEAFALETKEEKHRFCIKSVTTEGIGCLAGAGTLTFQKWLTNINKNYVFSRYELKGRIVKVYYYE